MYKLIPMDNELGLLLLFAFGMWLMWWSLNTAKRGFYMGTNEYGANLGKICKEKKPLTFWGAISTVGALGLGLVFLSLKAIFSGN